MNEKTATIINSVARITQQRPRTLKKLWYGANRKERTSLRRAFRLVVGAHRKKVQEVFNSTNALMM